MRPLARAEARRADAAQAAAFRKTERGSGNGDSVRVEDVDVETPPPGVGVFELHREQLRFTAAGVVLEIGQDVLELARKKAAAEGLRDALRAGGTRAEVAQPGMVLDLQAAA